MRITWRQRLIDHPEYRDFAAWPFIDVVTLRPEQRPDFLRNQSIVAQVLAGQRQQDIAAKSSLNRSGISKLMQRCLGGDDEEDPPLTKGLIPYRQVSPSQRRTTLPTLQEPGGARGALAALLKQLPSVKDGLDKTLSGSLKRLANGQNVLPKAFHDDFLRLLREAQWPSDRYPLTEKSQGYESLRCYMHKRSAELRAPKATSSRVIRSATTQLGIYEEIQIDEHTFDAHGRIDLELDGGYEPLRISRITVACMVDKVSDARLGFQICLTQHPSQFDLLALLHQLHAPWQPMTLLTPGLAYAPDACMPTALGFPFTHIGPGIFRFDNAMCHTAHRVRHVICDRMSATLNLGLVAQPKGRNVVEHAFDLVSDQARRLASTTGSYPHDPRREARKHRHKAPAISLLNIEEALSVIITQHNATAQARLGGHTPLDVLRYQMDNSWPQLLSELRLRNLNSFIQRQQVPVHWYKHEKRAPHLNFEHERYSGDALREPAVTNSNVIVEFDIRDIRELSVYDLHGLFLGKVSAPLSWQRYPHGVTTRRYIHALTKSSRLQSQDPLGGYFAYLLEHRDRAKQALELIRVYREFHRGITTFIQPAPKPPPTPPTPSAPAGPARTIPDWNPTLFN